MTACSGGSSGEKTPAVLAVTSVHSNAAIESGATLSGLNKIAVSATGTDASRIGVSFDSEHAPSQPLVRDLAKPGQFWLPVVLARTAGTLSISLPDRPSVGMAMTLVPFPTPVVPGAATRDYLKASLSTTDAAIRDLSAARPLPGLLQALDAATELTRQELAWVRNAMQNGTAIMATDKDGTQAIMTTDVLKVLDQMVSHTEALRLDRRTALAGPTVSQWSKILDFMMHRPVAQLSDSEAFIIGARATSDALGLTASMVPGVAATGTDAFWHGANAQVASLNLAGLHAAHYGNALAMIQTLPDLTFPQPVNHADSAVSTLFASVLNEVRLPDLDSLDRGNAVDLIGQLTDSADNAALKNIMMDKVAAFRARKVRIYLCPAGTIAMDDPEIDFILCAGK